MLKYKEKQCDKLVQEISCLQFSQKSGKPAECGHHIIHRGNHLWRWRLLNIVPLTVEEHGLTHAGLLNPLHSYQEKFLEEHNNDSLNKYLRENGMIEKEFVQLSYDYLKEVKNKLETGKTTMLKVLQKEIEKYV